MASFQRQSELTIIAEQYDGTTASAERIRDLMGEPTGVSREANRGFEETNPEANDAGARQAWEAMSGKGKLLTNPENPDVMPPPQRGGRVWVESEQRWQPVEVGDWVVQGTVGVSVMSDADFQAAIS